MLDLGLCNVCVIHGNVGFIKYYIGLDVINILWC